jgi:hypothetical protein
MLSIYSIYDESKKFDALVERTSNFFQKDPKLTFRNFKNEKALKTLLKSSFMQKNKFLTFS